MPEIARQAVFGAQEERILERLASLDPDLMTYIRDFAYDTVYERPCLDLKTHLRGALRAGATEQEVREAPLFCIPYLGFPRVVAGFGQLQGLLKKD